MNTTEFNPPTGIAQTIAPRVRRILAPNPSPMTYRGTNTYLIGQGSLAIIDPGPLDDAWRFDNGMGQFPCFAARWRFGRFSCVMSYVEGAQAPCAISGPRRAH